MKNHILILLALALLSACNDSTKSRTTNEPTLSDYQVGEKWVWKQKGLTTEGGVRSDGSDTREVVKKIRTQGAMNVIISSEILDKKELTKMLAKVPSMAGLELASKVSTKEAYEYGDNEAGFKPRFRNWVIVIVKFWGVLLIQGDHNYCDLPN